MNTTSTEVWITSSVISFILLLLNLSIVIKECETRKSKDVLFASKYLALWSGLCMITAPIASLFCTLQYCPGFCYIPSYVYRIVAFAQLLFVGYYQLSRLYYCFARDKVYSNKGYPTCTFVIMFGMPIICYFALIYFISDHHIISCGIDDKYQAYHTNSQTMRHPKFASRASVIALGIFIIWDFVTLMLYIHKIRMFTTYCNPETQIKNRILSILHKIAIVTLFYHFMELLILVCIRLISTLTVIDSTVTVINFIALLYNYSIYVIMDHNEKSYQLFLNILFKSKLYFVCYCCCKPMIIQQLDDIRSTELKVMESRTDNTSANPTIDNTAYGTTIHDISANHAKIVVRERPFSDVTTVN